MGANIYKNRKPAIFFHLTGIPVHDRVSVLSVFQKPGTVALAVILLAGMASFALVRYQFRIRGFLMNLIVAGMMFPVFSTIIPVYQLQSKMGITATHSRHFSKWSCR